MTLAKLTAAILALMAVTVLAACGGDPTPTLKPRVQIIVGTATPLPPLPAPTRTWVPTATPVPTSTPQPTATPAPTSTPSLSTATPWPTQTPFPRALRRGRGIGNQAYAGGLALAVALKDNCIRLGLLTKFVETQEDLLKAAFDSGIAQVGAFEIELLTELATELDGPYGEQAWPEIYAGLVEGLQDGREEHC